MSTVKIGIVEDEMIIALDIARSLKELGYDTTKIANSYTQALDMIAKEKPDILLLDIQLGGHKDGIDLAAVVKAEYQIPYIFLTANADTATVDRAKQVTPQAYLLKPFRKNDLYTAIELCLHNFTKEEKSTEEKTEGNYVVKDAVFVKQGSLFHKVKLEDILYLESDNVYVNLYTTNGKLLVRATLPDYLALLSSDFLVRVHRSFAVNVNHIQSISTEFLLVNKTEIPVGKTYRDGLLDHFRLG